MIDVEWKTLPNFILLTVKTDNLFFAAVCQKWRPLARGGKEDADDNADDVAEVCYEETSSLGEVSYNLGDLVTNLDTAQTPKYGKEYPRPQQHDADPSQQVHVVGSGAKGGYYFRIWN